MTFPPSLLDSTAATSLPVLSAPMRGGIAVNVDSTLIAVSSADTNTVYIYKLDSAGSTIGVPVTYNSLSTASVPPKFVHSPVSFVRRDYTDTLLIVSGGNDRIVEISVTGVWIRDIAVAAQPDCVSYSRGVIIVSQLDASVVSLIDYSSGSVIRSVTISSTPQSAFGVRMSRDGGFFFVAEYANSRVSKYSIDSATFVSFVATAAANGVSYPTDVLECDDGSLIVTNINANTIIVVNRAGVTTQTIGSSGSSIGQFDLPFSLAYSSVFGVLVKEMNNGGRVQAIPTRPTQVRVECDCLHCTRNACQCQCRTYLV
jgi:hypothetical protein